ncbi:MAG: peptidoglycan D,D-transpeptidase FtsI family protein [Coriobacteriales bacterium]|jgi:cell division protein FtsI (penicillin-binding protein 3)
MSRYDDHRGRQNGRGSRTRDGRGNGRLRADRPARSPYEAGMFSEGDSSRTSWLLIAFVFIAVALVIRLFVLQVVFADEYRAEAETHHTSDEVVYAKRGTIYDRNGKILAMTVDAKTIYANPKEIVDASATASQLAEILGGEPADYMEALTKDTTFSYVLRQGEVKLAENLQARKKELQEQIDALQLPEGSSPPANPLAGIYYLDDTRREYPYGEVAGQIIGYVGRDGKGLSGLELQYDNILRGRDGHRVVEQGKGGLQIPGGTKLDQEAVDGTDITVSIDIELQQYAEHELLAQQAESNAEGGEITILDGATGEIYASASLPLYDLNHVDEAAEGASNLKTVSHVYEPGSVFKIVTAAALLEEGAVDPDKKIEVPNSLEIGDRTITDAHDHAVMQWNLRDIIRESSNIGISILEDEIDRETFASYLDKFGFGKKTGVDYPGESEGILTDVRHWYDVLEANVAFGQSISVTSVQMAGFYGMVANDGMYIQPHFLIDYPHTSQEVTYESTRLLSPETCATLKEMMIDVVEEGTGTLAQIDGFDAAGKTGTAQQVVDGQYSDGKYTITFDGMLANTNSKLVCIIAMNNPGTSAAMPLFSSVMAFAADLYSIIPYAPPSADADTGDADESGEYDEGESSSDEDSSDESSYDENYDASYDEGPGESEGDSPNADGSYEGNGGEQNGKAA